MNTPDGTRWAAALAAVFLAAAATTAALLADSGPSIRADYAPLGPGLGPIAQALELPVKDVARVKYGREIASFIAPVPNSATESVSVDIQRLISRDGEVRTVLNLAARRHPPGSDVIFTPWTLTKSLTSNEFVMSLDLLRVELRTSLCDERTGDTKSLSLTWRPEHRDYINYGILAARGGDATATGRFGDQELKATLATAHIQLWGGVNRFADRVDPHVRLAGKRLKPVKCPVQ
jgi:hypothetical protein